MGNPLKSASHALNRVVKETKRAVGIAANVATLGAVSPNIAGGFTNSGAAAALAPPAPVDAAAGDNTAKYAADQEELARRGAAGFGGVADDGSDADTLGASTGGIKRRAAARALLG